MSLSVPSSRLVLDFREAADALKINEKIKILHWRGDPLLVPLSLWDLDEVADLSATSTLTLLVKETADADDDTALMSDTKAVFTADDGLGEDSCCTFDFTSAECNLAAALWATAETSIDLFAYIYAIGDDGEKRRQAAPSPPPPAPRRCWTLHRPLPASTPILPLPSRVPPSAMTWCSASPTPALSPLEFLKRGYRRLIPSR